MKILSRLPFLEAHSIGPVDRLDNEDVWRQEMAVRHGIPVPSKG